MVKYKGFRYSIEMPEGTYSGDAEEVRIEYMADLSGSPSDWTITLKGTGPFYVALKGQKPND